MPSWTDESWHPLPVMTEQRKEREEELVIGGGKKGRKEGGGGEGEIGRLQSTVRYASCVYALRRSAP